MRGEFIGVWSETWREIWLPLIDHEGVPEDIFCELYRELAGSPKKPGALRVTPSLEVLADIIDSPAQGRAAFEGTAGEALSSESALVRFLEAAHPALDDLDGDALSNRYFNLLAAFIEKFSLRYDLRCPCALCPTLPGLLTNLVQHMRSASQADAHLAKLNHEFEEALRDLKHGRTESRIKSCLTKQYILDRGHREYAQRDEWGDTRATVQSSILAASDPKGSCREHLWFPVRLSGTWPRWEPQGSTT